MPANERPGMVRLDLWLPADLLAEVDRLAGPGNRTAWIVRQVARGAKVRVKLRGRGRPRKSRPAHGGRP